MRLFKKPSLSKKTSEQSGVALFMVIASMTVLSLLVTEFTFISQTQNRMAYDAMDQVKAHYLAKSAYKLSLLRLKAYKTVKQYTAKQGMGVPRSLVDKIWSFPFFYPIPREIPGLSLSDREAIDKFEKSSRLEGKFTSIIESESSKLNLNNILEAYSNQFPTPTPTPGNEPTPTPDPNNPTPTPTPFNSEAARQNLTSSIERLFTTRAEDDRNFQEQYRDITPSDLTDSIAGWIDRTYEKRGRFEYETIPRKGMPMFSLSELRMISPIDDELFKFLSPNFTVFSTPGINVNTLTDKTLKFLFPQITKQEIEDFFKYRDSTEADNSFKTADDFFKYIRDKTSYFRGDDKTMASTREDFTKKGLTFITDESVFKITARAQFNQATKIIEAWVSFEPDQPSSGSGGNAQTPQTPATNTPPGQPGAPQPSTSTQSTGIKVLFMRLL